MPRRPRGPKQVEALRHEDATRTNIPTAEDRSVMEDDDRSPIEVAYERRNLDLDPQLVWRGKEEQDRHNLEVQAPPLYIQEKVHPKVLIDDLLRHSRNAEDGGASPVEGYQPSMDLFSDFNGLPEGADRTDFYEHDANWSNRMILGDSLQVMASLAEREGLRGKVQCIYIDPPYGIKFNSNFQWSTTTRDVRDGKADHITREPEQVRAFRDTWRDGIHSYLSYLRDRLEAARDLLVDSGSVFVQIGDENVHRVRALMDEVLGEENFLREIVVAKTAGLGSGYLPAAVDFVLWYARNADAFRANDLHVDKAANDGSDAVYRKFDDFGDIYRIDNLTSPNQGVESCLFDAEVNGRVYSLPSSSQWKTKREGMDNLWMAGRLEAARGLYYRRYLRDYPVKGLNNLWQDTGTGGFVEEKVYVVQTNAKIIQRCLLMATNPGDLVLDPTCGSGTTAYIAEQWGRRWITIDTSRVALALARARIMGARYPYYLLSDSVEGRLKEAEITRTEASNAPSYGDVRQGFVYERVPHIQLRDIANNVEIAVIHSRKQPEVDALLEALNRSLQRHAVRFTVEDGGRAGQQIEFSSPPDSAVPLPPGQEMVANALLEWEVPRSAPEDWPSEAATALAALHEVRSNRQQEIDASIAAKADFEYLYDKPYTDNRKVRVAGPFTVESLSPHRVLGVDEDDELIDGMQEQLAGYDEPKDFATMILENLETAGVQQAHKEDRISFSSLTPWPGELVCAVGRYTEGGSGDNGAGGVEKRAGIFIGPEFGTVTRPDLVEAAREAADAGFDALIACAFNYEAHTTEFNKLGRVPVLKARMNADLHMADDLKNTGKGNLFVIFGEPDIDILDASDDDAEPGQIKVRVNGVDVFHPNTGEVRSDGPDGIACWFVDTDYNQESFFVRHAYFLGQNDPYKSLKTTLKAEINQEAWETLNSDTSRPFDKPESGRIAVKVINHLGDEVMKVFRVD